MNAKAPDAITEPELALLPLAAIAPSDNPVQARRRRRFTEASIAELADNIAQQSLLQPILVRPIFREDAAQARYEIVAGERRYLAHQLLQRENITAIIRAIDDRDVIGLQLSENLNRETLHPLDESEGYALLMKPAADGGQGLSADQVAEAMGVSRRQVFNRLKLLNMAPAVQEALEAGTLDTSKALLIARLPAQKLQKKALELVTGYGGRERSLREFARELSGEFMVSLARVPFDPTDDTLKPGACTACPNYSPNDAELQAELEAEEPGARMCIEPACHGRKVVQFFDRRVQRARDAGRTVIEGAEAKALKPKNWSQIQGYVDLDEQCGEAEMPDDLTEEQQEDWTPPSYREVLGLAADQVPEQAVLFIDPHNQQPRDLVPEKDLQKLLKAKGIKYVIARLPVEPQASDAEREAAKLAARKEQDRLQQERAYRAELLRQVHAKWKPPLKTEDLRLIADMALEDIYGDDALQLIYPDGADGSVEIETGKMKDRELGALLIALALNDSLNPHSTGTPLLALAKRLRVDPAKVRKQVKTQLAQPTPKED